MVKIDIEEKYCPFSHRPGTPLLLPHSGWKVVAYPARLLFQKVEEEEMRALTLRIPPPIHQFTALQDLERGGVRVWGRGGSGYFCYRILPALEGITLTLERIDEGLLLCDLEGRSYALTKGESLHLPASASPLFTPNRERLYLGSSKKQDWCLIRRRLSLAEILPLWFEMGKGLPSSDQESSSPLEECWGLASRKQRAFIGPALLQLFQSSFEGGLVPRLFDSDYMGYVGKAKEEASLRSPLFLLGEGARLIRSLFIKWEEEGRLALLPCLPKELLAGRLIHSAVSPTLCVALRFAKGRPFAAQLRVLKSQQLQLSFGPSLASFRFREGARSMGKRCAVEDPLCLEEEKKK